MKKIAIFCFLLIGGLLTASCETGQPKRVKGEVAFTADSLMTMAKSFHLANDLRNAMRLYKRAAQENTEHIPSRLGLAKVFRSLGAADQAALYYNEVLVLDPENLDAKIGLASMLVAANKPDEVFAFLGSLAEDQKRNHKLYNVLGLAHDLKGEHGKAQLAYGRGLDIKPDDTGILNNLGLSFAIEEQYAPAIRLLSKAINVDYTKTTAQHNLFMVYFMSGEEDAARKMAKSLISPEEITQEIKRFKWLQSLTTARRAQAIFLGISAFPKEDPAVKVEETKKVGVSPQKVLDPKKQELIDILAEEEK